jgi:hypothetical protein
MICSAELGLTEDLYILVVQKEDFSITYCICDTYILQRRNMLIRHKPLLSSERMLRNGYGRKGSVEK